MSIIVMKDITYIDKSYDATYIEHTVHDLLVGEGVAFALYYTLRRFHDKERGYTSLCIASRGNELDLTTILGVTEPTIRKKIKFLEAKGLIRTEKVSTSTGNKKILFYVYQPIVIE